MEEKTDGYDVTWTPPKVGEVLQILQEYLENHPSGEHIMQSDEAQIEGLELLSEIADIVRPEYYTISKPK